MRRDYSGGNDMPTLGAVARALRVLEDRVEDIAISVETKPNEPYAGTDRRKDAAFSDEQRKQIREISRDDKDAAAGNALYRLLFWVACSAAAGAGGVLFAYLGFKH